MLHLIDEEEKKDIHYQRFHHPHPRVQLKMEVIWLYGWGKGKREEGKVMNF